MPTNTYSTQVSSIHNTQEILGHPNPPPLTQNYMIEKIQSITLKAKVINLYEETTKQFLNPTLNPKISH